MHCSLILLFYTGGVDYDPGFYFIMIPAGLTDVSFNITISPDNIFEGDEAFLLTIDQVSLQTVMISNISAMIVIIDDDCEHSELLT